MAPSGYGARSAWCTDPETERQRHYHLLRLADAFDVVIHVDATRAVTGVDVVEGPREPAGAVG